MVERMTEITHPYFSFTKFTSDTEMLTSAYSVINNLEKWDFLRDYIVDPEKGYCFDTNPTVLQILNEIEEKHPGHSGTTLGLTIRSMEYIAKHGFRKFRREYLRNSGRANELSYYDNNYNDYDNINNDNNDNDEKMNIKKIYNNTYDEECVISCEEKQEEFSCPVCLEDFTNRNKVVTLRCQHLVCKTCIMTMNVNKKQIDTLSCPLCRDEICHAHIRDAVKSQYPRKDYPFDAKFDFMNISVEAMLMSGYQVINETDTWDTLQFYRLFIEKNDILLPVHSEMKMIIGKLIDKFPQHTDKTIAYILKQLLYISKHGYQRYTQLYMSIITP